MRAGALVCAALFAGALAPPAAAAPAPVPTGTVLLTLVQNPGTTTALHRLARTRADAARRKALQALAPAATHEDAVTSWARAHHLTVASADRWTVRVTGPADALGRLLGTAVRHGLATGELRVPPELARDVSTVQGLERTPRLRSHAVPFGLTGASLRVQYGVPLDGWTGAGLTVGTLNLTGWNSGDLSTYAAAAGLPLAPDQITTVQVDGARLTPDGSGDDLEVAMDAEAVLATAPAAKQRMYFAPNNGYGMIDAFSKMADDGAAGLLQVATTSWGLCESDASPGYRAAVALQVDRMLAAGVTLFAAAGDAGMYDCSTSTAVDNTPMVDFPASYPGVVAVGGTRLGSVSSLPAAETAWGTIAANPGTSFAGYGGGGGSSPAYPRPSYQAGLLPAGTGRLVPDVASEADPATGLGVYDAGAGGWIGGGGTSLGAPTWAGLTAAALSAAGRRTGLGDIHAVLYAHPEAFHDITSGSNGYDATSGFDQATGLGTPSWSVLGPLLTGSSPPPVDTAAPTTTATAALVSPTGTRARFAWTGHDPAPSSGLSAYAVSVAQVGGGTVWSSAATSATSVELALVPGRSYRLSAQSRDTAGHVGPAATAQVTVPYDESALGHSAGWTRSARAGDFLGRHLAARARGSSSSITFVGRAVTVGLLTLPSGGYADVYLDGRRTGRLDLWSATARPRQNRTLGRWATRGRHTLRLVVLGAHRVGATNSYVCVDSVTVTP